MLSVVCLNGQARTPYPPERKDPSAQAASGIPRGRWDISTGVPKMQENVFAVVSVGYSWSPEVPGGGGGTRSRCTVVGTTPPASALTHFPFAVVSVDKGGVLGRLRRLRLRRSVWTPKNPRVSSRTPLRASYSVCAFNRAQSSVEASVQPPVPVRLPSPVNRRYILTPCCGPCTSLDWCLTSSEAISGALACGFVSVSAVCQHAGGQVSLRLSRQILGKARPLIRCCLGRLPNHCRLAIDNPGLPFILMFVEKDSTRARRRKKCWSAVGVGQRSWTAGS